MKKSVYKSENGKKAILKFYENNLKNWPVPFSEQLIATRFGNTMVRESGKKDASPLVLLHGSCTNSLMWMGDVEKFSRSFRVLTVDIIGEPGKSDENRPSVSVMQYGEWILDILNELQIDCASFAGNSLGGWIALNFAVKYPKRVSKLVLLAASGIIPARISFLFKAIMLLSMGEWGNRKMNRIVYNDVSIPDEAVEFSDLVFKHFNPRMEPLYIFSDNELKNLKMPVFYAGGEFDALLHSKKTVCRLKKLLPDVQAHIIPGAGHVLINMADDIVDFLTVSVHTDKRDCGVKNG